MLIPTTYDAQIKSASQHYLPGKNWLRLKAQLYQESLLKPDAQSSAGAQGIAQFMPATWTEARNAISAPPDASPFDLNYAIPAAAWYMSTLYRAWRVPRSEIDRWRLALASYNAGLGNLFHAQEKSKGAVAFKDIISNLHLVTGDKNAHQTIEYVARIEAYYQQLEAGI